MSKLIQFTKLVGAGNDFVLIDNRRYKISLKRQLAQLAIKMCDRTRGAGADGLLVLERSKKADVAMRIFNADGTEAQMCGNGARVFAYYYVNQHGQKGKKKTCLEIETKAGSVTAVIQQDNVKINLTPPTKLQLDIPLEVSGRQIHVNFINTGVPHTVIFVEGVENIDVAGLGRQIRYHKRFAPAGTNVNFVEVLSKDAIKIRTYERGVEGETLACGTGSTAAALIAGMKLPVAVHKINVHTQGKEVLKVYFQKTPSGFGDVWLEGKATIVYKGAYHV